jgi:hypothetical protein
MTWTRYLFHDFFTARELNRMDDRVRRLRKSQMSRVNLQANLADRVEQLEDDLGRMTLFAHALAETCVRHGLLTREQIAAVAGEIDMADGQADGKLDPATLRPEATQQPDRPVSPEEHLHDMEKRRQQSPGEFLSDLEKKRRNQ